MNSWVAESIGKLGTKFLQECYKLDHKLSVKEPLCLSFYKKQADSLVGAEVDAGPGRVSHKALSSCDPTG